MSAAGKMTRRQMLASSLSAAVGPDENAEPDVEASLNEKKLEVIRLILDIYFNRPEQLEKVFAEFDAVMDNETAPKAEVAS